MIVTIQKGYYNLYNISHNYTDEMIYMSNRSAREMRHKSAIILSNDNSGCYRYRRHIVIDPSLIELSYYTATKFDSLSNISNHVHDIKRITIQQQYCDETEEDYE